MLDEPVNGLDPQGIVEVRELLLKLNRERQITVLISSHILDELSRLATHYGFIDHGHMLKEISAEELEKACRKCICVEVSDTKTLALILDKMGMDYAVHSDTQADIYGTIQITELVTMLKKEQCEVMRIHEREESLESYYIRLIGGGEDA